MRPQPSRPLQEQVELVAVSFANPLIAVFCLLDADERVLHRLDKRVAARGKFTNSLPPISLLVREE